MALAEWAIRLARDQLAAALPRRWSHVQGVIGRATEIRWVARPEEDLLLAAAALHDVGYAPNVIESGFAPLDAARYLRQQHAPDRLVNLVANYSGTRIEGELRGLGAQLAEFPDELTVVRDALWYCDLLVGPAGQAMTLDERRAEWHERFADDKIVLRWVELVGPELTGAICRTEDRLAAGVHVEHQGAALP